MRYPIQHKYLKNGFELVFNQLFGENKNSKWYGPEGHSGLDARMRTDFTYEKRGEWKWDNGVWKGGELERVPTGYWEKIGRIPIVACHKGSVKLVLHDDKQGVGWGLYIYSEPIKEKGILAFYRTLYWHIETPITSLARFNGFIENIKQLKTRYDGRIVNEGAVIAYGGNNGMSSGPHLHLALDKLVDGKWRRIDPMPYFRDNQVFCYSRSSESYGKRFYQGKEITMNEYQAIKQQLNLPKPII